MKNNNNNNRGWLDKYRPTTLNDCVLPKARKDFFQTFLTGSRIPTILFCGGFGIGKTSLAKIIANDVGTYGDFSFNPHHNYVRFDSYKEAQITSELVERLTSATICDDKTDIWIFDEIDKLQPRYQNKFLGAMEDRTQRNAFILIANDLDRMSPAIVNRCTAINLDLRPFHRQEMFHGLVAMGVRIFKSEGIKFNLDDLKHLAGKHWDCPRAFINSIEVYSQSGKLRLFHA